ncbi:MAG: site-specific DNA-methyltransferase [Acidobacteriota bacterium]|nr:site-specific DNA-methyltransferase [Acidobacteriota bacterium]
MAIQDAAIIKTQLGSAYLADSFQFLDKLPANIAQLIFSSPPFSGVADNDHLNSVSEGHADWLMKFIKQFERLLSPGGNVVIELGSTRTSSFMGRRVDCFEIIARACREEGWHLIQEFYWYNPKFLGNSNYGDEETPVSFRDAVTICCWFSRQSEMKPDLRRVSKFNNAFTLEYSNLLTLTDNADDENYIEACRSAGFEPHQDRFPCSFPHYFLELLTERGDLVLDPFAGSCTTGAVAEKLGRRWICIERNRDLLSTASLRFGRNEYSG